MHPSHQSLESSDLSAAQAQFGLISNLKGSVTQGGAETRQQLQSATAVTFESWLPFPDARGS
jgi:hypothetical protein